MVKLATACRDYDQLVVLTVLEAAFEEEVRMQDVLVGELFREMMSQFRQEASLILGVSMLMRAVKKAKEQQDIDGTPKNADEVEG